MTSSAPSIIQIDATTFVRVGAITAVRDELSSNETVIFLTGGGHVRTSGVTAQYLYDILSREQAGPLL